MISLQLKQHIAKKTWNKHSMQQRKGKWVAYRDDKFIITEKIHMMVNGLWDLYMPIWNCNGCLKTDGWYLENIFKRTDIAIHIETPQCIASKLLDVQGYRWESICCPQSWIPWSTRRSTGVAVLYKKDLHNRVHVVYKDVDASYIWVCIKRGGFG